MRPSCLRIEGRPQLLTHNMQFTPFWIRLALFLPIVNTQKKGWLPFSLKFYITDCSGITHKWYDLKKEENKPLIYFPSSWSQRCSKIVFPCIPLKHNSVALLISGRSYLNSFFFNSSIPERCKAMINVVTTQWMSFTHCPLGFMDGFKGCLKKNNKERN